jgi:copper transport outer membrane protein MctB
MFDFRYHALSLVAVLIALALGLLLGVAIGDKGLVSSAESDLRANLRKDVVKARGEADALRRELADRRRIEANDFYPIMVSERLASGEIGVVAFGNVSDRLVDLTSEALKGSGAEVASVTVIGEPLDLAALAAASRGTPFEALETDPGLARRLGRQVGVQLSEGRRMPRGMRTALLRRSSGRVVPLTGAVLVRDVPQLDEPDATVAQSFEDGVVEGMTSRATQVVGAEASDAKNSEIPWFQDRRLPSVDNLDLLEGRVALVLALAGERGSFGVKPTADSLLPSVATPSGR